MNARLAPQKQKRPTFARSAKVDAKKVHAREELSGNEDLLRAFDLNYKFGPCTGISRLERLFFARRNFFFTLRVAPPTK